MGLSLHWWSQRWRGNFAAAGGVGRRVLSKCRMQWSPRARWAGRTGGKLGFVPTLELAASSLIILSSVKSCSRTALGPQRPAVAQQSSSPGQPDSTPLLHCWVWGVNHQIPVGHPLDSLTPWSPRGLLLWVSGEESYSMSVSVTFHPSGGGSGTQVWHLFLLHQRCFYVTEISFHCMGDWRFPIPLYFMFFSYICRNWYDRMGLVLENGFLTGKRPPQQIIYIPTMERHSACIQTWKQVKCSIALAWTL